jgi:hypothetical protein
MQLQGTKHTYFVYRIKSPICDVRYLDRSLLCSYHGQLLEGRYGFLDWSRISLQHYTLNLSGMTSPRLTLALPRIRWTVYFYTTSSSSFLIILFFMTSVVSRTFLLVDYSHCLFCLLASLFLVERIPASFLPVFVANCARSI